MRRLVALAAAMTCCALPASAAAQDLAIPAATAIEVRADGDTFFCSGSLIGPDVVLTAGHCLVDLGRTGTPVLDPARTQVRAKVGAGQGSEARQGINAVAWRAAFEGIKLNFESGDARQVSERFDIGVIRLSQEVPGVVPLQLGGLPPIGSVVEEIGYTSARKRQVRFVRVRSVKSCDEPKNKGKLTLCAGKITRRNPPCGGDSGGPLVFQGKQVGILSGYNPGRRGEHRFCGQVPFIYTRTDTPKAQAVINSLPPRSG